jgi:MFS family permease
MIARLADSLGRKEVVVCAFAIFATFSLACGWSKSMTRLIIFRGLQGIGGAGLYSMCMVLCPELCPTRMIPLISTVLGVIVAVSGISGPVLGGIITSEANWRWIFWLKYVQHQKLTRKGSITQLWMSSKPPQRSTKYFDLTYITSFKQVKMP